MSEPRPTVCRQCRYSNGGLFSVCPICKQEQMVKRQRKHRNRHPALRQAGARRP